MFTTQFFTEKGRPRLLLALILLVALSLRLYHLSSVPVGINGDELFNAIDAMQIGNGRWPIFFEGNQGREALFIYLVAASMRLLGKTIFAFRLPAVILGAGNVALGYWLGRDLFNRRVGLLAAGLTAVSLWPLMESRWSLRAVSLTFFTALTLYWLHQGLQSGRRRYWAAGGAALGLTLYTYIPGRLFPAVALAWFGWLFWRERETARRNWRGMLLSLGIAALVFAPFGWYMARYPDKVNQRVGNLHSALDDALNGNPAALAEPITAVLRMFTIEGDGEWRYHVAGKPIFDPVTGLFFYAGVAVSLWMAFRPPRDNRDRGASSSYVLPLLWAGAMLSPDALLDSNASFLRAAGAIIPLYLITAVGFDAVYQAVVKRWSPVGKRPYLPALVALGLLLILADTWRSYFDIWNNAPKVRDIYQADIAQMGLFLKDAPIPPEQRLFIAHPYAYDAAPRMLSYYTDQTASWFVPAQGFVWGDADSVYLVPVDENLDAAGLPPAVLETAVTHIPYDDGTAAFRLYKLSGSQIAQSPQRPLNIQFENGPTLIGADTPTTLQRGQTIRLTLYWQVPPRQSSSPTQLAYTHARLEDEQGRVWEQTGSLMPYPQAGWHSGDRFSQPINLNIPDGLPPGPVYVRFDLSDNEGHLYPLADNSEENRAGPFIVRSQPLTDFRLEPDMLLFDNTVILEKATLSTLTEPGLPIDIALDWIALDKPAVDYRVQFQLYAPETAEPILTQITPILPDSYPPSHWGAREQIRSLHRFNIPPDIPTEHAILTLRLQLLPPDEETPVPIPQGDNRIAEITLKVRERLFETPPINHPVTAQFGPNIRLLGYDVDPPARGPGDEVELTLYWQATATPVKNYTVFNHLIGPDGQLVGQFDSPPAGDAWLTSAWLPGEVIIDRRAIPVDSGAEDGRYAIAIGLYTNEAGRLPVTINGEPQANDQLVLTEITISR